MMIYGFRRWAWLSLLVAMIVATLAIAPATQVAASTATSASLTIVKIKCIKKQDSGLNGKDEPKIMLDGTKIWKGSGFSDGTIVQVNETRTIGYSGYVEVWELDSSPFDADDIIGSFVAYASEAGTGDHTKFMQGSGSQYEVTYHVL